MNAWVQATRPKTLAAGIVPVAVGGAFGYACMGELRLLPLIACFVGALLIQIATNFANDAIDAQTGADNEQRVGPQRAVATGLITPKAMIRATLLLLVLAFGLGLYLTSIGGWFILAGGIISLCCAWAYTGGPFPLAYHGLGDLFVLLFFGFFAVLGSAWIQCAPIFPDIFFLHGSLLASAVGLQATAIIAVNNWRDRETDAQANKRTLAVRFSPLLYRFYCAGIYICTSLALGTLAYITASFFLYISVALSIIGGTWCWLQIFSRSGSQLNSVLAQAAALELLTGILLTIGLISEI